VFAEPLISNEKRDILYRAFAYQRQEGYTYRHRGLWEGFVKYPFEVGSGAMISFIKNGSGNQNLI
jgi:hypothetical protein